MRNTFRIRIAVAACLVFSPAMLFSQVPRPKATPPARTAAADPVAVAGSDADAYFRRGKAAWKEFEVAATIENYTKALELHPGHADALRERGAVYYLIGRYEDAVRDLSAFLKTQKAVPDVLFFRGMAYSSIAKARLDAVAKETEASETAEKAYTDFNAAIRLDPSNALYYNGRGRLCVDFKLFDEAIADLEKAILLDAKFAVAYSNLGLAKLLSARAGLAELNRAIELNPRLGEAYFNRANYHRVHGDLDSALSDYSKAIAEHGADAQYHNGRGMVHFALQNGPLAVKDFSAAISQKQDYAIAYLNRAMAYKKFPEAAVESSDADLGDIIVAQHRKMKADLDAAIKYGPNLADAYLERGLMNWTATGSTLDAKTLAAINAALADFTRAIELDPALAKAYASRGAVHKKLGKRDYALTDYNKAIELDPRLATAYLGRMAIHCEMGNKELSFADEKRASELGVATLNICSLRK